MGAGSGSGLDQSSFVVLPAFVVESVPHRVVCVSPADDGKLSLEEFQAFFSDGTLNEEELEKLFHTIDSDNTRSEAPQHRLQTARHSIHLHGACGRLPLCL